MSDTIKRGTLSKNQKNCLDLVNNETKIQPQANPPHPRPGWTARPTSNKYPGSPEAGSAQNHITRPRTRYRFSDSPEAPHRKASDEVSILRLARGPAPRGLGRGTDSPTRPRPRATRPWTSHRFSDSPEAHAMRPRTSTQLPTRSRPARHQPHHRRLDRLL